MPVGGAMQISEAGIRVTEPNISGYSIYRVAGVLKIDAGSAIGRGRLRCTTRVPGSAIVAHTPGSRASYPRSSSGESLIKQGLPEVVLPQLNTPRPHPAVLGLTN